MNLIVRRFVFLLLLPMLSVSIFSVSILASAQTSEVTITTSNFGDWKSRCEQIKGQAKNCVITQQAVVQESGQRLMQANVVSQNSDPKMTLILPLGFYLPAGAKMQIGENSSRELVVNSCIQAGCIVNLDLDGLLVRALTGGDSVHVVIQIKDGQDVKIPLSMTGFRDALQSL